MKYIHFTIYTFLLLLGDLGSKYFAEKYLDTRVPLLGDWIYLELFYNPGIAFSIAITGLLLKILTIFLIFGILYYYFFSGWEKRSCLKDIAIGLILAGALGNAFERIFEGYVTDFIGVRFFSIFNIADSYITIGAILFLYITYRKTQ